MYVFLAMVYKWFSLAFTSTHDGKVSAVLMMASKVRTARKLLSFVLLALSFENVLSTSAVLCGKEVICSMKIATSSYSGRRLRLFQNSTMGLLSHPPFFTSSSIRTERHWRFSISKRTLVTRLWVLALSNTCTRHVRLDDVRGNRRWTLVVLERLATLHHILPYVASDFYI